MTSTPAVSSRYRTRKQTSGRNGNVTYFVYDLVGHGRVTVHAHPSREGAQYEADDLNVSDMIRDYVDDPRDYWVRWTEAAAAYKQATGREVQR